MTSTRWRWAVMLLAAASVACHGETEHAKPLHVVLIVVDTLRADHLSTYGYHRATSPVLDALAKEGAVFEHAVSQCSWTQPSMVSMMTGAYLADEVTKIPADKTTLASVFQKAGFATGAFIYNNALNPEMGFQAGFDVFDYQDPPYGPIDKISKWIAANRGKKSFTFIHLNEAHDPYGQSPEFTRWAHEKDALGETRLAWYDEISRELNLPATEESVRRINEEIGGYDDDVRYSDDHIGKVLDALRATGEWAQTAIVVAADHGEGLWTRVEYMTAPRIKSRDSGEPQTLFNTLQKTHGNRVSRELVHVPLILVAPGMPAATRVRPWVENVDIGPTLLELCDLARPLGMEGNSLLPLWTQPDVAAHQKRGAFTHTRYVSSFIDQDGFQMIKPTDRGECEFDLVDELYDLSKDPEARVNLARSDEKRVKTMKQEVDARMKSAIRSSSVTVPSKGQEDSLNGLGYLDGGQVDSIDKKCAAESVDELLADLSNPKIVNCLERMRYAIALTQRTFNDTQRAKLREMRGREVSGAIQTVLDELLAK